MLEPSKSVDATASPGTSTNNFFRVSITGAVDHDAHSVDGAAINNHILADLAELFAGVGAGVPDLEFQLRPFNQATSVSRSTSSRAAVNELHGSAFIYYRDNNITTFQIIGRDANRFNDPKLNNPFFARRQRGQSGRPDQEDRLFSFFNFENNNQDGVFTVNNNHAIYTQYDHVAPNPLSAKQANAKFDWKVNEKHNAFIRLSTDNNDNYNPNGGSACPRTRSSPRTSRPRRKAASARSLRRAWSTTCVTLMAFTAPTSIIRLLTIAAIRFSVWGSAGRRSARAALFASTPRPDAAEPRDTFVSTDRHSQLAERLPPAARRGRVGTYTPSAVGPSMNRRQSRCTIHQRLQTRLPEWRPHAGPQKRFNLAGHLQLAAGKLESGLQ